MTKPAKAGTSGTTGERARSRHIVVLVAGQPFPPTLSTADTARLWGCSAERLYSEMGTGRLPVEPLALGRRYRWPTVRVAEAIGLPTEVVNASESAA